MPESSRVALIEKLRAILPAHAVLTDAEAMKPYECDGLSAYRQLPMLVVLPQSVDEVQAILKVAHETGTKVVARGSGTGLSGGATPLGDGILLSLPNSIVLSALIRWRARRVFSRVCAT